MTPLTKSAVFALVKKEAIKLAEEDLKALQWAEAYGSPRKGEKTAADEKVLNPDWHPYYVRVRQEDDGIVFTMVVRDEEIAYFEKRKLPVPDYETPARSGMRKALKKYHTQLVMVELIKNFTATTGVKEAVWL